MNNKIVENSQSPKSKFIRDPIHEFIKISQDEQRILDSAEFQRLRDINQLSFTYLVYPGATHKRFEHSLGVMHVAGKIFDTLFDDMTDNDIKEKFGLNANRKDYWRKVLRLAALCHDIGHLPFSHTLEGLLKEEKDESHEDLSKEIIKTDLVKEFNEIGVNPKDVADVATWKEKEKLVNGNESKVNKNIDITWQQVTGRIITSDLFGADRIDYIIRDAYHAGVPYGNIDIPQLLRAIKSIDKLLINPHGDNKESILHIKEGDKAMLASFLMSRQLMYSLVYQHPVCKVYDMHLEDFVRVNLKRKIKSVKDLKDKSDCYILNMLHTALEGNKSSLASIYARRILERQHFKLWDGLSEHFNYYKNKGHDNLRFTYIEKGKEVNRIALMCSQINKRFKRTVVGYQSRIMNSEEQINDTFSGYGQLLEVLQKGDFGYCYTYIECGMEDQICEFLETLGNTS